MANLRALKVTIIPPEKWYGKTMYRLEEPMAFIGPYDLEFTVPKGFVSDGGTIPRFLWWLFPPDGEYFFATIFHDYALENDMGREVADNIFEMALKAHDVASWRRKPMVAFVRLYGNIKTLYNKVRG